MGLRKLAQKNGMKLAQNKVYGELLGYAVTLSEGIGYKRMDVTAKFEDGAKIDRLLGMLHREGLIKKFQIRNLEVGENYISILFAGHAGMIQKLEEFADWLLPMLPQFGVLGSEHCARCGQILEDQGCWKLVNGRAIHVHRGCLTHLDEQARPERTGTYGKSLALGLVWAIALVLGLHMVYILSFPIGRDLVGLSPRNGSSALTGMLSEEDPGETVGALPTDDQIELAQDLDEPPTSVTLDQENLELEQGSTAVLVVTLNTDWKGIIVWGTSDPNVATVTPIWDNIARVDYVREGTCSIVAMAATGLEEPPYASCRVVCDPVSEEQENEESTNTDTFEEEHGDTITEYADEYADSASNQTEPNSTNDSEEEYGDSMTEHVDIALNAADLMLYVGDRHRLMDENSDQVTWTSDDESVATVDETGTVTAVAPGVCAITATGPDGAAASSIIRVRY